MKEENIILQKTYDFGPRVLKLYLHLRKNKVDIGLCSQLLNIGTSIGANIEEAVGGSSRKDFINKLQTAYKEARETRHWLRLLNDGKILEKKLSDSFLKDCEEIIRNINRNFEFIKGKQFLILNF